ncbi:MULTISPECIES: FecR domain-containing protein [unclassified Novosphingobium]|uniref:FecR family protein n=1 Tax=unclassified Novosphingobium TaxID=2644732 RepID=UPI00135B9430|nr:MULTISPECIES: FecR domain-containing protein [unclassified Novosphingobium]
MTATRQPMSPEIAAAAADWIVRRDGGRMTAEDEQAFALWLAEPAHSDAVARLERIWDLLNGDDELGQHGGEAEPVAELPRQRVLPVPARGYGPRPTPRLRRGALASGGVAAALALVVLGGVQDWPMRMRADHMTGIGERREIALSDGSVVQLDSGSAIALDYTGPRRGVRLLAGAAMFDVAPDRARPFTVDAEGGSVTALGTAFAVRDEGGRATVTVTRHSVRVQDAGRAAVVGEGQRADFGRGTLTGPLPAQGDAAAWTRGRLVVVDRPLGEVVAQIDRYRRGYVAVTGPAAAIRVSGVYDLEHPLAAIDSIEKSLGLSSLRLSDRFIILRR